MDLYGQDEAISQLNSRNQSVIEHNQEVNDYNNAVMERYQQAKDSENMDDDLTYGKDLISNVISGQGLKVAFDNRKETLRKANKKLLNDKAVDPQKPVSQADKDMGLPRSRMVGGDEFVEDLPNRPGVFKPKPKGPIPNVSYASLTGDATDPYNTKTTSAPTPIKPAEPVDPVEEGKPQGLTKPILQETEEEGKTITGVAINKLTGGGIGSETAETLGKGIGGITSAGYGAVALTDDIENMVKNHGDPFKKDASWEDDTNNVGQIVGGVSDIIGLVPGLEWVAGVGNIASGIGSVIGMFGDHDKNKTHDANVEGIKGNLKSTASAPSSTGQISYSAPSTLKTMESMGSTTF